MSLGSVLRTGSAGRWGGDTTVEGVYAASGLVWREMVGGGPSELRVEEALETPGGGGEIVDLECDGGGGGIVRLYPGSGMSKFLEG